MPIRNYFPPDTNPDHISVFDVTQAIMSWLTNLIGPYPFDEYGVVVVPGFASALETQTMSIFGETMRTPSVILHELVHQWYGNSVSLADWQDIWLHEVSPLISRRSGSSSNMAQMHTTTLSARC